MRGTLCRFALLPILLVVPNVAASEPITIEIVRAELGFDQRTGQPVITFRMTESSKRLFADFTSKNIGRPMEMRVDGRVIHKPVIREPILGGSGQLTGFGVDEGKALAERLSSGSTKLEVEAD